MRESHKVCRGAFQDKFVLPAISSVIPAQAGIQVPQHYDISAIAIPPPSWGQALAPGFRLPCRNNGFLVE